MHGMLTVPLVSTDDMDTDSLSQHRAVEVVEGVHLTQLVSGEQMSIQHYHFEPGATVPEHDHPHEQSGFLYKGALTFFGPDESTVVGTGESYLLPSHEPHRVVNHGEDAAIGIDIFSPPRPNPDWS